VLATATAGLVKTIKGCRDACFDYLFIDTPPSATAEISDVVARADLCIIPVRPNTVQLGRF